MNNSRKSLRKARQERNKAKLTAEQKQKHPKAAEQYVIFGGKRGNAQGRSFEHFVAQHG